MKVLYVGGQKSGKSYLAEQKILAISQKKPYYIATYDNSYGDVEMADRVNTHQQRRQAQFITIEEPLFLNKVIKEGESYLVDCLSMWIMNLLASDEDFEQILQAVLAIDADIVFVLNDVTSGIIPENVLSREYIDMSGVIGQMVARGCDEVYQVIVGLEKRLK
ncbi:MAG: bifunctional adenosylcobinamide kinase/adenosylcobinamide-phosphate guanylyltransferase [Epsilonproteobacteria bacterium]|nr:bifunctional adenosylcobinamide kinase/adenosylcobinamide-phosphate guanylyltransferase [Campylobacterota bacterium]